LSGPSCCSLRRSIRADPLQVSDLQLRLTTPPARDASGTVVDEFALLPDSPLPWSVDERTTFLVVVRYTPADAVPDSAEIVLTSNDTEHPSLVVTAMSQVLERGLRVDPAAPSFELAAGETEATVELRFENTGDPPICRSRATGSSACRCCTARCPDDPAPRRRSHPASWWPCQGCK
ncbi:hypothetical protein L6V77_35270, partial [Myxococcota bacterium]|nr:hypothetical protein [Myxococcota bacterium]